MTTKKPMRVPLLPKVTGGEMDFLRALNGHPIVYRYASEEAKDLAFGLVEKRLAEKLEDQDVVRISDLGTEYAIAYGMTLAEVEETFENIESRAEYDPEAATSLERQLHAQVLLLNVIRSGDEVRDMTELALGTRLLRFRRDT